MKVTDPSTRLYCTSCGVEGDRKGSEKELLRLCERCGFLFCTHCGTGDRFSSQFMCNNCWKEKANKLLSLGKYDEAISIFERIGDSESIQEVHYRKSMEGPKRKERLVTFRRSVVSADDEHLLVTEIEGNVVSDIYLSAVKKSDLVSRVGWELAPMFYAVHSYFRGKEPLTGIFQLDMNDGKVKKASFEKVPFDPPHIFFTRVRVKGTGTSGWATVIDDELVMDALISRMEKEDIVRDMGWRKVSLLSAVAGKAKREGPYLYDIGSRRVYFIGEKIHHRGDNSD